MDEFRKLLEDGLELRYVVFDRAERSFVSHKVIGVNDDGQLISTPSQTRAVREEEWVDRIDTPIEDEENGV